MRSCLRAFAILAVVAFVAIVVASQLGTARLIEAYQVLDEDTILIHTSSGNLAWRRVTDVVETGESVDITVKSYDAPVPQTLVAYPAFFVVDLEEPLGDRRVVDRSADVPLVDR